MSAGKLRDGRPLIAHVVFRFDTGGLENGVVNLLNGLPPDRYRHAVISLTQVTAFRERITRRDVEFVSLDKRPGHGIRLFPQLYREFRRLRPSVVHTRNLAALEASVPAMLAGVPVRIHGEHGRDVTDPDGSSRKYRIARRMHRPFVTHYVALSKDLEWYLAEAIGVPTRRVTRIVNGVDTTRFSPGTIPAMVPGCPFTDPGITVFGSVGRLQPVKNQVHLVRAFAKLVRTAPELRKRIRLAIVGEGPSRIEIERALAEDGVAELAWIPGSREDVVAIMRRLDIFVLPSIAEGISNTILEAMASGLPVIATAVGGNTELVQDGLTGKLVASQDVGALAAAMARYAADPGLARAHGAAGRARAVASFSVDRMVDEYAALYDRLLGRHAVVPAMPRRVARSAHADAAGEGR